MCRTVACWSYFFGVDGTDGGKGGSSPFVVIDEAWGVAEPALRREDSPEPVEPDDRREPSFSQVKGGPETWMGFGWERPIVAGRVA